MYLSKRQHRFYLEQLHSLVRLALSCLQVLVLQCLTKRLDAELSAFTFSLLETKRDMRSGSCVCSKKDLESGRSGSARLCCQALQWRASAYLQSFKSLANQTRSHAVCRL